MMPDLIKSLTDINLTDYSGCYTSCIILTENNHLMLQQRGFDWHTFPGFTSAFGGKVEKDETPVQAIVRELHEETGAVVLEDELVSFGAYTEKATNFKDIIFGYFWHDVHGSITGCYEGDALYFSSIKEVHDNPAVMDDVNWLLAQCQRCNLLS